MTTTNIHLAKHQDGSTVNRADLKLGLEIDFPSGMGGSFGYKCVAINDQFAHFKCTHKEWPLELTMSFDESDFSPAELLQLEGTMKSFSTFNCVPSDADHQLVNRAHALGLVRRRSQTQVEWCEHGLNALKEIRHA